MMPTMKLENCFDVVHGLRVIEAPISENSCTCIGTGFCLSTA
jgi:hypothetical protein